MTEFLSIAPFLKYRPSTIRFGFENVSIEFPSRITFPGVCARSVIGNNEVAPALKSMTVLCHVPSFRTITSPGLAEVMAEFNSTGLETIISLFAVNDPADTEQKIAMIAAAIKTIFKRLLFIINFVFRSIFFSCCFRFFCFANILNCSIFRQWSESSLG